MSQMRERMPNGELTDFRRRLKVWTSRENYYWKR
jgi:hypothetical protein